MERQTERLATVLANSEILFNPLYLKRLREVIDEDILVYEKSGKVAITTLSPRDLANISHYIHTENVISTFASGKRDSYHYNLETENESFLIVSRSLQFPDGSKPDNVLCVITPLKDITRAKAIVSMSLLGIGISGLSLSVLFGWTLARTITRPVQELVSVTGDIAEGQFHKKVRLPKIVELMNLSIAINTMSDRLSTYEKQIIQSSKLAAAGKITASLAHEIRNPLSGIKMLTQLLRDRVKDNPENLQMVRSLLEEVERIERIVNDVMQLMRPSDLKLLPHYLNELVEELVPLLTLKMDHLKIKMDIKLKPGLPPAHIDRDRIKQVIWNLILNAVDSMPSGGLVTVSTGKKLNEEALFLSVEDEGTGIGEEVMDHVFDPFFTTKSEGLGLGLATSKDIVEAHGGKLRVENKKDKGVWAWIEIPVAPHPVLPPQMGKGCNNDAE